MSLRYRAGSTAYCLVKSHYFAEHSKTAAKSWGHSILQTVQIGTKLLAVSAEQPTSEQRDYLLFCCSRVKFS